MKIVTASNGKKKVKISKAEWKDIGKKAGWMKKAYDSGDFEDRLRKEDDQTRTYLDEKGLFLKEEPSGTRGNISGVEIPEEVWLKAEALAGSIYQMNAKSATWYVFSIDKTGTDIAHGEYKSSILSDLQDIRNFDGYIVV